MEKAHLLLKWGSIKGWRNANESDMVFLRKYHEEPVSVSAIAQRDTETQKQALIDLIENWSGTITNDWDGNDYTKDQAKDYVLNYGSKS